MKKNTLVSRLSRFMATWLSNPSAQLEFVELVEATHQQPRADHADDALLEWIDDERDNLKSIGVPR
jgi:hypothetical protein